MASNDRGSGEDAGRLHRRAAVCITQVATEHKVKANYRQPNANDWRELLDESTEWGGCDYSSFFEIWAEEGDWRRDVRKVVLAAEPDRRMQVILFLASEGPLWPEGCVLVTAPGNRHGYESREYAGVGTVLVAYLIEESIHRGKNGALRFQIDPNAQDAQIATSAATLSWRHRTSTLPTARGRSPRTGKR